MLKFLFLDFRDYETVKGFERKLERPRKSILNPIYRPDASWENGLMTLYGSVVRRPDGLFQLWYSIKLPEDGGLALAYLESDDGFEWRRPQLDVFEWKGEKTNIVFTRSPHGATVFYDELERNKKRRYKMLCGAAPSHKISAFCSADGIHWQPASPNPVIHSNPDCPMSLHRKENGLYVAYHRPGFGDRRVGRSESWDFEYWTPAQMVLEPGPDDPPQLQFYGMGSAPYGPFEIGTLWMYHTVADDPLWSKMQGYQEAELTYARSGTAWHRAAQGEPFIPHGRKGSWEMGNLQCASAPVYCDDEIRFYYAASTRFHAQKWEGATYDAGLGVAVAKPDRFVGLRAGERTAEIVSRIFTLSSPEIFLNADIARDGEVTLELLDDKCQPLAGFRSQRINGNGTALPVAWQSTPDLITILKKPLRFQLRAKNAKIYSVWMSDGDDAPCYHRFRETGFLDPQWEIEGKLPE